MGKKKIIIICAVIILLILAMILFNKAGSDKAGSKGETATTETVQESKEPQNEAASTEEDNGFEPLEIEEEYNVDIDEEGYTGVISD